MRNNLTNSILINNMKTDMSDVTTMKQYPGTFTTKSYTEDIFKTYYVINKLNAYLVINDLVDINNRL